MKTLFFFFGSLALGFFFIGSLTYGTQDLQANLIQNPVQTKEIVAQSLVAEESPVVAKSTTPLTDQSPVIATVVQTPPQVESSDNGENKPILYNVYNNALDSNYKPSDLAKFADYGIKTTSGSGRDEVQARTIIMSDLKALIDICENESGQSVYIRSGFRSYRTQTWTFGSYGSRFSAYPGTSEHQLGVAIDIEAHASKTKGFLSKTHPVYECFMAHAYDYGFIQSYPKGNLYGFGEEPWHWRYVGKSASQSLMAQGKQAMPWELFGVTPIERKILVASADTSFGLEQSEQEVLHSSSALEQKSNNDQNRIEELRKKFNRQKLEERMEKQERAKALKEKWEKE